MNTYPTRFQDIDAWAIQNGLSREEARRRFAQFVILAAFSQSRALREALVFKGGNALDFVWQPNRSTLDLDFSIDHEAVRFDIGPKSIEQLIGRALEAYQQRVEALLRVHGVRQQPPGPNRAFPAFIARIGYALPDQKSLQRRMRDGRPSPHVIDVEISSNEIIGATALIQLDDTLPSFRVSTVEDIVAEKLRALLQQPIRNRQRRQDLLDIAVLLRLHQQLDRENVARFLILKSEEGASTPERARSETSKSSAGHVSTTMR